MIDSATGWRAVETLRIGDLVHSFDGGARRVQGLDRNWLAPGEAAGLMLVPGGAFDNCSDLVLPEHQHLLIDTLGDPDLPDAMMVLIPAAALVGFRGVRRVPVARPLEVVTPLFADEAIYANSGALLYCPAMAHGAGRLPQGDDFARLDLASARALLRRIEDFDAPTPIALRVA